MLTLRVIPPRLLAGWGTPVPRDLTAVYFDALWRHWSAADRTLALAIACGEAARTALRGPEAWSHGWDRSEDALFEGAADRRAHLGMAARKGLHRLVNPGAYPLERNPLKNKRLFAERCRAAGLPAPAFFDAAAGGLAAWLAGEQAVIAKPNFASKGAGVEGLRRAGDGWISAGVRLTERAALARLTTALARGGVVQRACETHPALVPLSPAALPTLRVMTAVDEAGAIEVCGRVIRLNAGPRAVDNFNAGNIAAGVDRDGRVRTGLRRAGARLEKLDRHPVTGARLRGCPVPDLVEAEALAVRAHEAFRTGFAVVGWDVGLTADGPVLIEGNWNPGADILQLVSREGVGDGRLGAIYRHWLARLPAETWRAARPVQPERKRSGARAALDPCRAEAGYR